MTRKPLEIEFSLDDRAAVLDAMARLARQRKGWINLHPGIAEDEVPLDAAPLTRIFSARGPAVPICTWVPGRAKRRGGHEPTSVGIQHPSGPRALATLAKQGLGKPPGWRVLEDNPRRGLVLHLPDDAALEDVLDWMLRSAVALSTIRPTGDWLAVVHEP